MEDIKDEGVHALRTAGAPDLLEASIGGCDRSEAQQLAEVLDGGEGQGRPA